MKSLEIFRSQLLERSSKKSIVTPVWGVETDNKEGSKDIVKAADDFASKVGSGKAVDKDKIHRSKVKRNSFNKKHRKGNLKRKRGKSTQSDKTYGKCPKKKNVVSPGKTMRRREYRQRWKEQFWKKWFEKKNGGKAKKGQK